MTETTPDSDVKFPPVVGAGPDGATISPATPGAAVVADLPDGIDLVHEHGLELKSRSQWAYARRRFFRHRLAMVSLVVLAVILLAGVFAPLITPYPFAAQDFANSGQPPTFKAHHYFGTDVLGRDYFSRVVYGIRTSAKVALIVTLVSTIVGTIIGAVAGYYTGWVDNVLMRFTDLILTLPGLAVLLTAAAFIGTGNPTRVAFILALLFWTGLARIVRGSFLSLREKEYVEAAKAAGSGDLRIMFRHMLPNAVGPIVVNATLIVGIAILTEAALSFLGFGIQPPNPSLGKLISDGQDVSSSMWWLVTFPGLTIVLIVLCINFIGDGLRDALDPTQRRTRA
ncbi:MAG: ABC transporter permease [Actinomycetota bacterium]|nr:ABC transporter permease [Actinomycetota bacterium]